MTDPATNVNKKPRKPREIKNPIVNIDDVSISHGFENMNWIKIAKQKLAVRELRRLHYRQQLMDQLVIDTIQQFTHDNKTTFDFSICLTIYHREIRQKLLNPQSAIMSLFLQSIGIVLGKWKGYKPKTNDVHSFREYFQHCRCWFDTKKIPIMTTNFWIPSMQLIKEFAKRAAAQLFPNRQGVFQTMFAEYLNVMVLKCVFGGKIKFPNSGIMWLIPSTYFKVFLERYNHHLRINVTISNLVLRRECVEYINSKHDVLKNAINEHVASSRAPTRKPVTPVPIQQNDEFQSDNARMNRANNYSVSPSYTLHRNYPPTPSAPLTNPYTSPVPPPVNQCSFDQMNRNQSTFSSYPAYTPNAPFPHTNTGANTNSCGPM
eukprot:683017_1